ncbi:MAG TPA: integrase, partial [Hyphomonas sp.]|nr:integrase [Hyphomonas sp.]
ELRVIIYLLVETGARLSEIVNLRPDDIRLDHEVPHIIIRPEQNRELKTSDSEREIPLVGVALPAMKLCPNGFEHYYDRNTLVSANLMKAFKQRELLPSKDHVIYSLRHSFEDRMLEGNLDYGLRCALMGHKNNRPEYGQGGSLAFRREQLLRIAHPFSDHLFD